MTSLKIFIAGVILITLAAFNFTLGYRVGSVDAMASVEKGRIAKMAHCAQTESLSSTVHTDTGDIEICVTGSHRESMQ